MVNHIKALTFIALCFLIAAPETVWADVIQEGWYRMRSQSNMKIGNYSAAIEAYEKLLKMEPNDRESLKGIALAYEKQGETDKAIARYDKYLALYHDDPETAFKQANFLMWSRYAYRRKDAIHYFEMGLKEQDNPKERLKFAQLLSQDKADLPRAVKQYQTLVDKDPDNQAVRKEYRQLLLWDDRYLDDAIEQYEYLVNRNPKDAENKQQLAVLYGKSRKQKEKGVEIYADLIKQRSNDYQLRHDYAKLLSLTPGHFDEARAQYEILREKKNNTAILIESAQLLEQKKSTRPEALKLYSEILRREPYNKNIRIKRAALYMNDKTTASLALKDYQGVIKQDPTNAEAHRGAAKALAWLERPDDALYHAKLAKKYSQNDRQSRQLQSALSKGREPKLSSNLDLARHGGDAQYQLDTVQFGVNVYGDVTPYLSLGASIGGEEFKGEEERASGSWWQLLSEYRINPQEKLNLVLENHGAREVGTKSTMHVSYSKFVDTTSWAYSAGYENELVDDSFLSLVGDSVNQIGGATRHEFFATFSKKYGEKMISFRPSMGLVESESESNNEFLKVTGSLRLPINVKAYDNPVPVGVDLTIASYAQDHSGFGKSTTEPKSGGYFSPQMLISSLFYAEVSKSLKNEALLNFKLGPKIQMVDDASVSYEGSAGFFGSVSYTLKKREWFYLSLRAQHDEIGGLYSSTILQGKATLVF